MRSLLAAALIGLAAAGVSDAAKAKESAIKTYTRKGLCSFKAPREWRVVENWKAETPSALIEFVDAAAGPLQIEIISYPAGNSKFPDRDAWTAQLMRPNQEFEKTVSSRTVTLDGRPAVLYHIELLDMLYVTARVGPKRKVQKDIIASDYAGGLATVTFSSPEKVYEARRGDFERFLGTFKLLAPKVKAPTENPAPVPSPTKP